VACIAAAVVIVAACGADDAVTTTQSSVPTESTWNPVGGLEVAPYALLIGALVPPEIPASETLPGGFYRAGSGVPIHLECGGRPTDYPNFGVRIEILPPDNAPPVLAFGGPATLKSVDIVWDIPPGSALGHYGVFARCTELPDRPLTPAETTRMNASFEVV